MTVIWNFENLCYMEKLLDKLSSYQLFNYLFPGIIFINLIDLLTSIQILYDRVEFIIFLYYIVGMILSRIGSVAIEPLYKGFCWVVFAGYKDYIEASKQDSKIDILSMENNTYRTLIATFVSLLVVYCLDLAQWFRDFNDSKYAVPVYVVLLIALFSFSYRKQTSFVRRRVHHSVNKKDEDEIEDIKKNKKYGRLTRICRKL